MSDAINGFDPGANIELSRITDSIYAQMWSVLKELDEAGEFYERVRIGCAEILISCILLIKAKNRMLALEKV
ncbi:hypothetical protein [Pseudoalteromonas denitrificans]|uniref:Uncharacterized protein n=1 Tax=Pseudoalteromonas denitrificans DSM 6059 TaxID=1123010 RepID=A0A1I1UPB3_9GAMM|nr:hypothetical protein [Pseudoalteromonas denitrificans]SFD70623.1 hypothetical protein SAMN02745724_05246 [Pseudoalteromonas denitrificans DSM 6059]